MKYAAVFAIYVGVAASACRPQPEPMQQNEEQISAFSVQHRFQMSEDENRFVDSLFERTRIELGMTHYAGVLYRFDRDSVPPHEYLLSMIPPPTYRDGEIVFVVLEAFNAVPPFHTGVPFSPRSLSVSGVDDYDGDDLPDVAYCIWPQDESTDGESRAVGLRDAVWYNIDGEIHPLPDCETG